MPGRLLNAGAKAVVTCMHGGKATAVMPNPRVKAGGEPTATLATTYTVAGCTFPPPPNGNGPCVTAKFVTAAMRVTSGGEALLLSDSSAICTPTGTKLLILTTQTRVAAK